MSTTAPAYRRPLPLIAVIGPALATLCALALLIAGPGSRAGLWSFGTGFTMMRYAAYAAIAAIILSALGAFVTRPGTNRRGFLLGVFGILLGAVCVLLPWNVRRSARGAPPIHDITTDMASPPEFVAIAPLREEARNPLEYGGEEVAAQQRAAYPDIVPLRLELPPERAFAAAHAAARDMGWEIVAADSGTGRIEATTRTRWFGFHDDIVVRVSAEGQGSRVDVRSKSRIGRGDMGANARRVRAYLNRVRQEAERQ